jgi:nitrite reductase/ring-hydroxylating ferredoxin subunit
MEFRFVCDEEAIPLGGKKRFNVNGESILVYHLEDGFYATQSRCPHMFASLEKGKIMNGHIIQCWIHKAQFDIKTGKVIRWAHFPPGIQALNVIRSEKGIKIYETKVEENKIYVRI